MNGKQEAKNPLQNLDTEAVNLFLTALNDSLAALGNKVSDKGPITLFETQQLKYDVSIMLRLSGPVQGAVVFGIDELTARRFASAFLMGIPMDTLDDLAKSSIDEFAIRISSIAKEELAKKRIVTQISSSVSYFKSISFAEKTPFIRVTFETTHGPIEVMLNVTKSFF